MVSLVIRLISIITWGKAAGRPAVYRSRRPGCPGFAGRFRVGHNDWIPALPTRVYCPRLTMAGSATVAQTHPRRTGLPMTNRPLRHRKTCGWILVAALSTAMAAGAGPASAEPPAQSLRAKAETVMAQIDRLDARRADALAQERQSRETLLAARAELSTTRARIANAEQGLAKAREALAQIVVSSYKKGAPDATSYLLASGSFHDLILRVDVIDRANRSGADLIRVIRHAQHQLDAERARQASVVERAQTALSEARAARRDAESILADRRATLGQLNTQIASLIHHEQHRRQELAKDNGGGGAGSGGSSGGGGGAGGASFSGQATWYSMPGAVTASGEIYDPEKLTCASPWLPFGTLVRVTLLSTGRSVVVRVNDRGPFGGGVLDLSVRAARDIGLLAAGRGQVHAQVVGFASAPARPLHRSALAA